MPRQRTRFVADAFHDVAVAGNHIGMMVDEVEIRPIKHRRQLLFRNRHPDRIGKPLTQRAGCRLNAHGRRLRSWPA